MNRFITLIFGFTFLTCSTNQEAKKKEEINEKVNHWDYNAENVDAYWASLNMAYSPCQDGKHQSPINIAHSVVVSHKLNIAYSGSHEAIENNGHTVVLKYDSGSYLNFDGRDYQLLQFHFHTPSEHYLKGKQYPLEAHLVHLSKDTVYLVYALLFETGDKNAFIQSFLDDVPDNTGDEVEKNNLIAATELTKDSTKHYIYEGSFTTPPCTEGVKWIIASNVKQISQEQIARLQDIEGENARQTHELFDREVERF